jgi:hypothetical protein
MADPQAARLNQLRNIQARTGKTIVELHDVLATSGLDKVGQYRELLMERFALGYGDANTVALFYGKPLPPLDDKSSTELEAQTSDPLDSIYTGVKANLLPLHRAFLEMIGTFGPFEESPKKSYISLRRKKQFAMVGPATRDLIEIGLNAKLIAPSTRLRLMPPGGMCQYTVRIGSPTDLDQELQGWVRIAYDMAG